MEYLKEFCLLNKITVQEETISQIVTALKEDSIVSEHIEVRLGTELDEKNYLWKVFKAYKSAKL